MIVDDSWFSPNYHQLHAHITIYHSHGQTAKEVHDKLTKVHRQSHKKKMPQRQGWASYLSTCIWHNIRSLPYLAPLLILYLSQWTFSDRLHFCVFPNSCQLMISSEDNIFSMLSWSSIFIFLCHDYHLVNTNIFWSYNWASRGVFGSHFKLASCFFGENSWPKTIMNYHWYMYTWSNEINYRELHLYHEEFKQPVASQE